MIMKFSIHFLRVWACVLLDEACKNADFIKNRFSWLGELYRLYLGDTPKINWQHCGALAEALNAVMELLDANMENSFQNITAEDTDSGEYDNRY